MPLPRTGEEKTDVDTPGRVANTGQWFSWPVAATVVAIGLPVLIVALFLGRIIEIKKGDFSIKIGDVIPLYDKLAQKDKQGGQASIPKTLTQDDVARLLDRGPKTLPIAKVLWVDDHPPNNQIARLALAALGIYCDSYTSTADAVEALNWNSQNTKRPYDIIISDWKRDNEKDEAGHELSGIDTYRAIRAFPNYRETPFIFFTADGLQAVEPIVNQDSHASSTNFFNVLFERVLQNIPTSTGSD